MDIRDKTLRDAGRFHTEMIRRRKPVDIPVGKTHDIHCLDPAAIIFHFLQHIVDLRRDYALIPEPLCLYDPCHLFFKFMLVSCRLDLDIQPNVILFCKIDHLRQQRNPLARISTVQKASHIKLSDLVISHFPCIAVNPRSALEICVVHHKDLPILTLLNVQLDPVRPKRLCPLKSRHRVLRIKHRSPAVRRHLHRADKLDLNIHFMMIDTVQVKTAAHHRYGKQRALHSIPDLSPSARLVRFRQRDMNHLLPLILFMSIIQDTNAGIAERRAKRRQNQQGDSQVNPHDRSRHDPKQL